jgi:type IV pilus assembly protein PilE
MNGQKGITLIELMVAVTVAGILSVIAISSYQSFYVRGNRAAAQAFMVDVASREKQYLLDVRSYTNSLAALYGVASTASAVPADVYKNYSSISVSVSAAPSAFIITATPTSSQQAVDGALTLSSDGSKGPAGKW